jgi:large subunit ribosomal protein L54
MAALLRIASGVTASSTTGLFAALLRTSHAPRALIHCGTAPSFAAAKGKGGGKGGAAAPSAGGAGASGGMSTTHCTGLNIVKGGSDPELGPEDAYPDWLWTLLDEPKSLTDLEKEVAAAKKTGRYDAMDVKDVKRLLKLRRRAKIRANNDARAK